MPKLSTAAAVAFTTVTACVCAIWPLTSASAATRNVLAATASPTATPTPSATPYVTGASTRAASTVSGGAGQTTDDTPSATATPDAPTATDGSATSGGTGTSDDNGTFGGTGTFGTGTWAGIGTSAGIGTVDGTGTSGDVGTVDGTGTSGTGTSGTGTSVGTGTADSTASPTPTTAPDGDIGSSGNPFVDSLFPFLSRYPFTGDASTTTPGGLLDLSNWYLTLPSGSAGDPDTVSQPALATYTSRWFQLDTAGDGVVFTADVGGVTTANSTYPRSELREMNGTAMASWSNTTGSNTMTLRQAVLALPTGKPDVVTAQIHDAVNDILEIRLQGDHLVAAYNNGHRQFTLDPAYVLGTPYDLRIVAAKGRIDVYYNDIHSGGFVKRGSGWYFKTGSYVQSNVAHGDAAEAVGQVVLFALGVDHSSSS